MSRWDWTGLTEKKWRKEEGEEIRPAKTAWDFVQLLIIPLALAGIALGFDNWQSERDARREQARDARAAFAAQEIRRDEILESYLSQMSALVLDRRLLRSREGSAVRAVARTLTLTSLRRLDGPRKAEVVGYLMDARLLRRSRRLETPIVDLAGADLRKAVLNRTQITGVFDGADLRGARFDQTGFVQASLRDAVMNGASFSDAYFIDVDMTGARLESAVLDGVGTLVNAGGAVRLPGEDRWNLDFACLHKASFRNANLLGADFGRAAGREVDLTGASIARRTLARAALVDSKLPPVEQIAGGLPVGWGPHGITAAALRWRTPGQRILIESAHCATR